MEKKFVDKDQSFYYGPSYTRGPPAGGGDINKVGYGCWQQNLIPLQTGNNRIFRMKAFFVVLSLIGAVTVANGQALTAAAAVVIGAKILIAKGFIWGAAKGTLARNIGSGTGFSFGGSGRHGREAADFNSVLTEENKRDVDDCAKLLVCHLNAKSLDQLDVSQKFIIFETYFLKN
jgi:hypothetical protein